MGFKFDGSRYITSGIQDKIPLAIQIMMFESLTFMERKAGELDRLQIIERRCKLWQCTLFSALFAVL